MINSLCYVQLPEIAEVYILASQASDGFCIFQLIDQLGNITEQLRVAFQVFGDSQQIEMIQQLLRKFQVSDSKTMPYSGELSRAKTS